MQKIRIAGVPEHFNLPWKNAIADGAFEDIGLEVVWTDVPEGTGRLCQMLSDGETDLAVVLTEGMIKAIHQGCPARIIQKYVQSPLLWGVHVAAHSSFQTEEELRGKKVAISRYGSGSELMAYVHAEQFNWPSNSLTFEVVHTLDGAVEALTNGQADYFLWERFMTQPIVDRGIFRRLGVCPTPWPSFVLTATTQFRASSADLIPKIQEIINLYTARFKTETETTVVQIIDTYGQLPDQILQWLELTEWATKNFAPTELAHVQEQLLHYGIIQQVIEDTKILG